jgi:hypothetical protein
MNFKDDDTFMRITQTISNEVSMSASTPDAPGEHQRMDRDGVNAERDVEGGASSSAGGRTESKSATVSQMVYADLMRLTEECEARIRKDSSSERMELSPAAVSCIVITAQECFSEFERRWAECQGQLVTL